MAAAQKKNTYTAAEVAELRNRQISLRIKRPPSQCLCIEMAVSIFIMV